MLEDSLVKLQIQSTELDNKLEEIEHLKFKLRKLASSIEGLPPEEIKPEELTSDKIDSLYDIASNSRTIKYAVLRHLPDTNQDSETIDSYLTGIFGEFQKFSELIESVEEKENLTSKQLQKLRQQYSDIKALKDRIFNREEVDDYLVILGISDNLIESKPSEDRNNYELNFNEVSLDELFDEPQELFAGEATLEEQNTIETSNNEIHNDLNEEEPYFEKFFIESNDIETILGHHTEMDQLQESQENPSNMTSCIECLPLEEIRDDEFTADKIESLCDADTVNIYLPDAHNNEESKESNYNLTKELEEVKVLYHTLSQELDKFKDLNYALTTELNEAKASIDHLTIELNESKSSNDCLIKELGEAKESNDWLNKEFEEVKTCNTNLTKELELAKDSYYVLSKELDESKASNDKLRKELEIITKVDDNL
ncbi:hypothetical protein M9Y10_010225 [Tritrichomonas musculus]|uniref:Uncharacterized protein n=1 Tax=Tritrichomonas musculus TaxID=1915356 RepID=A0ABR2IRY9_9EUKA